jgi:hypothetical protein
MRVRETPHRHASLAVGTKEPSGRVVTSRELNRKRFSAGLNRMPVPHKLLIFINFPKNGQNPPAGPF